MESNSSVSFSRKTREHLVRILSRAWEEEAVLSTTLQDFLGQSSGPNFQSIYRLFSDHYRQIDQWLGELADRTRALGATLGDDSHDLTRGAGRAARDVFGGRPAGNTVDQLLSLHEGIARELRRELSVASAEDAGTGAFLNRLIEFHETTAWMLRTVVRGTDVPAQAH